MEAMPSVRLGFSKLSHESPRLDSALQQDLYHSRSCAWIDTIFTGRTTKHRVTQLTAYVDYASAWPNDASHRNTTVTLHIRAARQDLSAQHTRYGITALAHHLLSSVYHEERPIAYRSMFPKPRLSRLRPSMQLIEVAACMLGRRLQYDTIANLLPPHGCQVCMALKRLAYMVNAMSYNSAISMLGPVLS